MAQNMAQHFTFAKLLRFTLPSVGMMVFMSLYVMIDGFFVSNWCGATALAAVNFAYPIPAILGSLGFMLGTGGNAIVASTLGSGNRKLANERFSMLVFAALFGGIAFAILGTATLRPLLAALGASGQMLEDGIVYGSILVMSVPFTILQYLFQELMMTAGKPDMAFGVTVVAGVVNIVLDAVLIVGAGLGVAGAAIGTMAGEAAGALIPLVYFMQKNASNLRLVRTRFDWRTLGRACWNGSSEMVSNIASSVVAMVYNIQLLAYLGEPGVAAYGVIMYAGFLFAAVFLGYCTGCAPLMSYHLGARNGEEMASLFRKSLLIVGVAGVGMFALTRVLVTPLATLFVGYDAGLLELTVHAALLYSFALLVMGFNVYGSSLFTAAGNGHVSALISFVRTFICEIGAVLLVPLVLGADGIWLSILVAEAVALVLTATMTCYLKPFHLDGARKKRK
ncbi:MATE family efflux transporter [uncultured Senegalimassilia sp.]|uniref:MATE family efflux transporter n=1 Tax=uncultured Senegalimassilia sp. TaxID=1714350 RepID=UPI00258E2B99|nr:MATE family efflux transporter [uncultured Senegalimassilia sp.]